MPLWIDRDGLAITVGDQPGDRFYRRLLFKGVNGAIEMVSKDEADDAVLSEVTAVYTKVTRNHHHRTLQGAQR